MRKMHGFTLLEILLAVSLLAIMVLVAMGTLSTAVRAMRSGERVVTQTDSVRIAQEFVRRQISHAMALPFQREEDTGMMYVFEGDEASMRFVAPMPGHLAKGGPHVQELHIARGAKGLQLEFTHTLLNGYDEASAASAERPPVLILDGMAEASFEYRGMTDTGELGEWASQWDAPHAPPMMVRLVAEFPPERRQFWPRLVIPVMSGALGVANSALPFGSLRDNEERRDRRARRPLQ